MSSWQPSMTSMTAPGTVLRPPLGSRRSAIRTDTGLAVTPAPSQAGRALAAEFLGSAALSATVIGSGIAATRLSPTDVGLQLLENAAATGLALYVLILLFGPVSGAHFNPVVSLLESMLGNRSWRTTAGYLPAQILGCFSGTIVANIMFELPAVSISTKSRAGSGLALAELLATVGLLLLIFGLARSGRGTNCAPAVGAYIGAAYFVTSSTSFANPAITLGRIFSDSFAGIAPSSAPLFIGMQLLGLPVAYLLVRLLYPDTPPRPAEDDDRSSNRG